MEAFIIYHKHSNEYKVMDRSLEPCSFHPAEASADQCPEAAVSGRAHPSVIVCESTLVLGAKKGQPASS